MIRKYICEVCDWYGTDKEVLDAPNPFSRDDSILGCPSCCEANVMHLACDIEECWNRATCHTLAPSGFVRICEGHFQGITGKSPSTVGGMGKSERPTAANPDFKQVFDFLTSIEGDGYGGMAEFEIARETMSAYRSPFVPIGKEIPEKGKTLPERHSNHGENLHRTRRNE